MATGRAYSGKEFSVRLGIRDQSDTALGTVVTNTAHTNVPVQYRLNGLNDIAWDGGFQRAEIDRSGTRIKRLEDVIDHYGSGVWTWDFDWTVDNEVGLQNLLNLIYPENTNGADSSSGFIIPAAPVTTAALNHGAGGTVDSTADIVIDNPVTAESRLMHGAILQNLTLSMDAGTDGGILKASGQFMTGYKPVIQDCDSIVNNSTSTASDFAYGLFDMTVHTVGGDDASIKTFSITMSNPATRVGFQGTGGEADGYSRAGNIDITGNIAIKADTNAMEHIDAWIAQSYDSGSGPAVTSISMNNASTFSFLLPGCVMNGHALDMANEGIFVDIPFTVTSGADAGVVPLTIKAT